MTKVSTTQELQTALAAGVDPGTIEFSAPGADIEAASKLAIETATVAERTRIEGITALATPGFDAEIQAAIKGGSSVEATALSLYTAAKDRGISLSSIKNDSTAAAAAAAAAGQGKQTFSTKSIWNGRKGKKQ